MPGKVKSRAEQAFLAIHKPKVLHELSGGSIPKGLPYKVGQSKKGPMESMFGKRGK